VVVLEGHFSSLDHPLQGDMPVRRHVPGAIQVHPSFLEAGPDESSYYPFYTCPQDGNLLPHAQLVLELEKLGITPGSTVVVYGTEPDGPMAAARLVWGLLVAGIESVLLLDGGIDAWVSYGGETASSVERAVKVAKQGESTTQTAQSEHAWSMRSELVVGTTEVEHISAGSEVSAKLVDVRKSGEFDGSMTRCYSFFSKAGHIPGATLQGDWVSLIDCDSLMIGGKLETIRERWKHLGIVDESVESGDTTLIFYCGTGWRSSVSFLVATLLGYTAKNYDDGFYGWSWNDERAVEFA